MATKKQVQELKHLASRQAQQDNAFTEEEKAYMKHMTTEQLGGVLPYMAINATEEGVKILNSLANKIKGFSTIHIQLSEDDMKL